MKLIFMGSAEFACPALEMLLNKGRDEICAVVSQPERPCGRSLKKRPCPAGALAAARSIPVLSPENINSADSLDNLRALSPDLIIVVAYGQFLKKELLELPRLGCVNLHGSLLPKYRGAAPIQWAIARGEQTTGVTTIVMSDKMDAGDIIMQEQEPILPDDTACSLGKRLAERGAKLLLETLDKIRDGSAQRQKQDDSAATFAPRLKKTDGIIDWSKPAFETENRIRGFQPWPCCFFMLNHNIKVKVFRARVENVCRGKPGTILEARGDGPLVQAGGGALRLLEVQPEGKKRMNGIAFLCGNKITEGAVLSTSA